MSAKKIFEVALILSATDKASRIINDMTVNAKKRIDGMSALGDKAFAVGRGVGTAGIIGATLLAAPLKAAADMEKLNVSLRTSFQGNEKAATDAFTKINKFAASTPYEVGEVTTAFIKLKNMGLDPGEEALTAYGNTASAMGKNLNDMIEAVADAATGEFERLKEFGIKAKSEGDKVTFTFQGVKTTVGKNSKEIERYLKYIGNVKFKGGIEAQSKTLYGMFSTLKDGVVMAAAKIGTTLMPRVKALMERIGPLVDRIAKWVENNPKLTGTILKVVAGATALSFAVAGLAFAFGGVFKTISAVMSIMKAYRTFMALMKAAQMAYTFTLLSTGSGFAAVSAGLKAMNLGFLTSPIFWIAAALVVVVLLIVKYWEPIKKFFGNLWEGIKVIFSKFWTWLKEWGLLLLGPIGFVIKYWDKFPAFFSALWEKVKSLFTKFWEFIKKWGLLLLGPIGLIIKYWDRIKQFFSDMWPKVKEIFWKALSWFVELPERFRKFGTDIVVGLWNGIKNKAAALFDYVKGMGKKIADTFKNVLGIASPSKVFMDYGVNITEGASKGIQKGQSAAVASSRNMANKVMPVSKAGSGGGGTPNITINFAPVISGGGNGQDVAAQIKALIPQLIREMEAAWARKQRLSY